MPRTQKNVPNNRLDKHVSLNVAKDDVISDSTNEDEDLQVTLFSPKPENQLSKLSGNPRKNQKRNYEATDDTEKDPNRLEFCEEMHEMFENFGENLNKSLQTKRKRLEQLTEATLNTSTKKIEDFFRVQMMDRCQLRKDFSNKMIKLLEQWEADMQKVKEHEDKLYKLLAQQQKTSQQKFKLLKDLLEKYLQASNELQSVYENKQNDIQHDLKKELTALQKKILMDTEVQEMANVRMSFFRAMYS